MLAAARSAERWRPQLGEPIGRGASGVAKRLDAFRRHASLSGRRLLDVGCGNGAYTTVMARDFDEVVAVDVAEEHLAEFRASLRDDPLGERISIERISAEALPYPDGHFDAVTAIEVLEHLDNLDVALGEITRVLRPGGTFFVAAPNRLFPIETHTFRLRPGGAERPGRLLPFLPYIGPLHRRIATARNFTAVELRRLMTARGLREVGVDHIMPPFDRWGLGRRLLRPITDRLERSPLGVFGVSVIGVYRK